MINISEELRWFGKVLSPEFNTVRIVVISDLHYGNPYCSVKHFARTIQYISENENVYCFLNGDLLEAVTKISRGDIHKQKISSQEQRDEVIELLKSIEDKILGMTTGNHENRIYNEVGIDLSKDIADSLGIPYRPEGMLFKLSFGNGKGVHARPAGTPFVFWGYITHGYGGARTKASKAIKVERISTWIHANFYAMSHDHVVNVAPDVYLLPDNRGTIDKNGFLSGKVTAHREMLVKTNAYLKWGGYSEMLGFPPSDLFTPIIFLLTPKSPEWKLLVEKPIQAVRVMA